MSDAQCGGIGTYVYHLAHGLAELGNEVHVVTSSREPQEPQLEGGVHLHRVGMELLELPSLQIAIPYTYFALSRNMAVWRYMSRLCREVDFDVADVSDHLAGGLWNAITGALPMCLRLQTPFFLLKELGTNDVPHNYDTELLSALELLCLQRADVLVGSNSLVSNHIQNGWGLHGRQLDVMPNPIVTNDQETPRSYERSGDQFTFLFVGRLEKRKGIKVLIEAFSRVVLEEPRFRLRIVGGDTVNAATSGSVRQELDELIAELGLIDVIQFEDPVPNAELQKIYRQVDALVVPSLFDNAPYTCVEAMVAGLPIIGTDAGGISEYLQSGSRGLIVGAGNVDELCEAMLELGRNEALRAKLGAAAQIFVRQNCDYREIARRSLSLYERLGKHMPASQAASALEKALDQWTSFFLPLAEKLIPEVETNYATDTVPYEIVAYDNGYQSGLRDGWHHALYSNPLVAGVHRMCNLVGEKRVPPGSN